MGDDRTALRGRRVLICRARDDGATLRDALEGLGADVLHLPAIRIEFAAYDATWAPHLHSLESGAFDWLLFTSRRAVTAMEAALAAAGLETRPRHGARVACVGEVTAATARRRGWRVRFVPREATARALARQLPLTGGARVFVPASARTGPETQRLLTARGARVTTLTAYRTCLAAPSARARRALAPGVDAVLLTSPSTLHGLRRMLSDPSGGQEPAVDFRALLGQASVICIGPTTAAAARKAGLAVAAEARPPGLEGLVDALRHTLTPDEFRPGPAQPVTSHP